MHAKFSLPVLPGISADCRDEQAGSLCSREQKQVATAQALKHEPST
jgi:hypothetical protein